MIGKIFITRTGYDPQLGKHVKDPFLGPKPTLGACRPDLRRRLKSGDHIFVISGKVPDVNQYIMAGFEVESKIDASEAYQLFPEHRLRKREDGQLTGNVIVDAEGRQHSLDDHKGFDKRITNYIIGTDPIILATAEEIAEGRMQTLEILRETLQKKGRSPIEIVGRWGTHLTAKQILELRDFLKGLKNTAN